MEEVLSLNSQIDETPTYVEDAENNEFIEYTANFLYTQQALHILPDDNHQILKTSINVGSYDKSKSSGVNQNKEDGENAPIMQTKRDDDDI